MDATSKKILIDVRLLARGGASGISEYTKNLLENMVREDKINTYTFFYNGFRKKALPDTLKSSPGNFVIDSRIPNKIFDFSSRFLKITPRQLKNTYDVIFSPHFNILHTPNTPRVITFHDLSFLHHPYFFSRKQNVWHWLQNYKAQAKKAQKIIAVSEFTKQDIVHLLEVNPDKISVIYSGIDSDHKIIPDEQVKGFERKKGLSFPFLLYLGTLEPRKNVPAIIRAFNIVKSQGAHKDLRLVLAGRPGWLYKSINDEVRKSPFKDKIIFWGAVSDVDRPFLYNAAKLFVYPSFFEGFGFPPLEAQACGTPVIVSNRTSLPEVVGDSAIQINPWEPEELSSAIQKVLADNDLRDRLSSAGLQNAERFSWKKSAEKTIQLLQEI